MTLLDYIRLRRLRGHHRSNQSDRMATRRKVRLPNPLRALAMVCQKDLIQLLLFNAMLYLVFIISVATLSPQFADIYHLNDLQIGLCYLPYGIGCCVSAIGQGYLLDWNYRRVAHKIGFSIDYKRGDDLSKFPIEKGPHPARPPHPERGPAGQHRLRLGRCSSTRPSLCRSR